MINNLGYNKPLFILPFDHRVSFKKIFGHDPNLIAQLKQIIYQAFKNSVSETIPKENAGILVDEQFGESILADAKKQDFITLLTTEKSGQKEFSFEYGEGFAQHLEKYKPTFAKALIHYNPDDVLEKNKRQEEKLKILSDWCHQHDYKFLLEILIVPSQSSPTLLIKSIGQLQRAGVEPDVWKTEGMEDKDDYESVVSKIKTGGRSNVGLVILGRGENKELVENWIRQGAGVAGVIGFAVGRTVFWQPVIDYQNGKISKEKAMETISKNYEHFYKIFISSKNSSL